MMYRWLLITALLLFIPPSLLRAESFVHPLSMEVRSTSSCETLDLSFGIFAENMYGETALVFDEFGTTLSTDSLNHEPLTLSGSLERTLSVPEAAGKASGYVGVRYNFFAAVAGETVQEVRTFAFFDCAKKRTLYSCVGSTQTCPAAAASYQPKAEYSAAAFNFGTNLIKDELPERYVRIYNRGVVGLRILHVSFEGRDAEAFHFLYGYNGLFAGVNHGYSEFEDIFVQFKPKTRSGEYRAALRIETNDPAEPVHVIPMVGDALKRADLRISFGKTSAIRTQGLVEFDGIIKVKNIGSLRSRAGKTVKIGLYDQNSCPGGYCYEYRGLIFETTVPAILPRKTHKIHFHTKSFNADAMHFDSADTLTATISGKGSEIDKYDNSAEFEF